MRCPRADFCFFANPLPGGPGSPVDRHKDRSARSVLNRGSFLKAKRAKHPSANAAGNPVLGLSHRVEPVASAASVSAERLAHCMTTQRAAALGADIGWTMRLSALRFPVFMWGAWSGKTASFLAWLA
jgi:hypothetical protein